MNNIKGKLYIVVIVAVLICGMMLMFNGCKEKEEEIPWWEDAENFEFVIEDERSLEKSFRCDKYYNGRIEFNYTYDETETEEYIPKVRILYKGVEQEIYTYIHERESFARYPEGVDYDHPYIENVIKEWGNYKVSLNFYLNEVDAYNLTNRIGDIYIYINVNKGEEL